MVDLIPAKLIIVPLILISILVIIFLISTFIYRNKFLLAKEYLEKSISKNNQLNDFMNFFAEAISSTEHFHDVYSSIANHIARITDAKNICIYELKNETDYLVPVGYTKGFPPLNMSRSFILSKPLYATDSLKQEKIKIGEGLLGEVAQKCQGVLLEDATVDNRLTGANNITPINSLIAIPMLSENNLCGVICAINTKTNKPFSQTNYDTLNSMTRLIVQVHNIIRAYSTIATQQRLSQELQFARLLQTSLLPKKFPDWSPFVIHAYSKSAKEVSGDFYDFVQVDDNRLLVLIGDASGKGIPACMVMAMTRSFIRANVERFTTLNDMLTELNTNLYRDTTANRFATLACCLIDKEEETIEFARAGHTELLCYSSKNIVRKINPHGTALGLLPQEISGSYDTFSFIFKPYYSVLMFTDGLTEANNSKNEEYGLETLEKVFYDSCKMKNSPRKATELILSSIEEFTDDAEQLDDQTIVVISHKDAFI